MTKITVEILEYEKTNSNMITKVTVGIINSIKNNS